MRVAELCAGYDGLYLSMLAAGWDVELAWVAENDPDAATVHTAHHPHVPNVGDLTAADWTACQPVDVIAAGYPCQPFSAAGRRLGMDDERWIWPDIARAVRLVRPRWVLLENVPGHLGRGASRVVGDLAALGYVGSWRCVRAADVGAPHRRERLFILAADAERIGLPAGRHDTRQPPIAEPVDCRTPALMPTPTARDGSSGPGHAASAQGSPDLRTVAALLPTPTAAHHTRNATVNRSPDDDGHPGWTLNDVAQADRWGRYTTAIDRWAAVLGRQAPDPTEPGRNGQPRLSPRFVEWLMGLPAGWVTDHVARNPALRILGNGVVPQQGAHALRLLAAHLDHHAASREVAR